MAMPRRTPSRKTSPNGKTPGKAQQSKDVASALRETTVPPRGSYARSTWKAT